MDFNKNDIEFYLLTKEYSELTDKELSIVNEAVESKEEYQSLRQLLLVMSEAPDEGTLIPDPKIKEELVAGFEKARFTKEVGATTKVIEFNNENKKKRGGFIWVSIAASLILLIGIYMNRESLFMPQNNQLALVESEDLNKLENPKLNNTDSKKEVEDNQNVLEDFEAEPLVNEVIESLEKNEDKQVDYLNSEYLEEKNEVEEEFADNESTLKLMEEPEKKSVIEASSSTEELDDFSDNAVYLNATADEEIVLTNLGSNKDLLIANASVSLENDKDLIGLLYTAM